LKGASMLNWYLDFIAAHNAQLPFTNIQSNKIQCSFENFKYNIVADEGSFIKVNNAALSIQPANNKIVIRLDEGL
jgi:hypothetical protein